MRWMRGRQREQQPAGKADKDQQLREAISPYAAGLTDDPGMTWDRYLREEFGIEADGEPATASPVATGPAPRPEAEGSQLGTLNLVARPFPGDRQWREDGRDAQGHGGDEPHPQAGEPSPVTIRRSETRLGGYVAIVRNEVVVLPEDACRCGTAACRSGWPADAPLIRSDPEAG